MFKVNNLKTNEVNYSKTNKNFFTTSLQNVKKNCDSNLFVNYKVKIYI